MHSQSFLFHNNHTWSKRNSESTFDITMGCFDWAAVCELVSLFILNSLQEVFGKNVGLYRDDGLALLSTKSGRLCNKVRKDLLRVFDNFGLKITTLTNQQCTNFLDTTIYRLHIFLHFIECEVVIKISHIKYKHHKLNHSNLKNRNQTYITNTPGNCALLASGRCLVSLTLNTWTEVKYFR